VERVEASCTASGDVTWLSGCGRQLVGVSKVKNTITI